MPLQCHPLRFLCWQLYQGLAERPPVLARQQDDGLSGGTCVGGQRGGICAYDAIGTLWEAWVKCRVMANRMVRKNGTNLRAMGQVHGGAQEVHDLLRGCRVGQPAQLENEGALVGGVRGSGDASGAAGGGRARQQAFPRGGELFQC